MKVCPECGYEDPPCWRPGVPKRRAIDVCTIDDLDIWQPELAKKLRSDNEVFTKYYAYRLRPSGWVTRRPMTLYKQMKWREPPMEKVARKYIRSKSRDSRQKPLFEKGSSS